MEADTLIADKAFDADARVLEPLAAAGKTAVIPPRGNRSCRATMTERSCGAPFNRELLRQYQAVSCNRHPIREDRAELPRCHPTHRQQRTSRSGGIAKARIGTVHHEPAMAASLRSNRRTSG